MSEVLTAHAYNRWTERVWPAPYGEVCAYIFTPERRAWIAMGAKRITMPADGVCLCIKDRNVVTVLTLEESKWPDDSPRYRRRRKKLPLHTRKARAKTLDRRSAR